MKKNLLITLSLLLCISSYARNKTITGIIKSSNVEVIQKLNALFPGISITTRTDYEGRFSIEVPKSGKTLDVSFTEYLKSKKTICSLLSL